MFWNKSGETIPQVHWYQMSIVRVHTENPLQNSLIFPWPWEKSFLPDFSLTRMNPDCALVKCRPVWSILTIFYWLHGLSRLLIGALPRTEMDHPTINHRWSVRRARVLLFLQHCLHDGISYFGKMASLNWNSPQGSQSFWWINSLIPGRCDWNLKLVNFKQISG